MTKKVEENEELKVFLIPVVWKETGTMRIEASSLKEAERLAIFEHDLPKNADYLTDSIEIDKDHPDYGNHYKL